MKSKGSIGSSTKRHMVVLFLLLFGFWIILSGKSGLKYIMIGFITSLVVVVVTRPLMHLKGEENREYEAYDLPYLNYILYLPWLLWQIIKANIDVALRVLNPKMPVEPQIITFKKDMSHPAAHMTLGNSITLTPGTVTIDIKRDTYIVHALTDEAAEGLVPEKGEGEMPAKVAHIFGEETAEGLEKEMVSARERRR